MCHHLIISNDNRDKHTLTGRFEVFNIVEYDILAHE
jgi:hypothetical protein